MSQSLPSSPDHGLFVADLRGLDLPAGAAERIANAVQQAVLTELAALHVPTDDMALERGITPDAVSVGLPWPLGLWFEPRVPHDGAE